MPPNEAMAKTTEGPVLLQRGDPEPAGLINGASDAPVVLVCDHAGRAVPAVLGDLGITEADIDSHAGWDVGAFGVAEYCARVLGAPLVFQRYSRLVYDCNRPPDAPDVIPEDVHGIGVAANRDLSDADRTRRQVEIFVPFDDAVSGLLRRPRRAAFSIHSFTPMLGGVERPWHVGLLSRSDPRTTDMLTAALASLSPDTVIGRNQPYTIADGSDWFIPRHAERLGLAHCLFEIRNDLIADADGQTLWGERIASAIRAVLEELA